MFRSALGYLLLVQLGLVGSALRPLLAEDFQVVRPAEGFASRDLASFSPQASLGGLAYLPDGRIATYETSSGQILVHGGAAPAPLATFAPAVFGSFLVVAPGGSALIFGENSDGGIFSVPLAGGEATLIDKIAFNYDLAFDSLGRGFVSAPGLIGNNSIRLLDQDPAAESREVVANIGGFSGPVAVDSEGNVYYGTANGALPGGQRILRFRRDLVDLALAGPPLEEGDGDLFLDELPGLYNLRVAGDRAYFTDLGFTTGTGVLFGAEVGPVANVFPIAAFQVPAGLCSPSFLAFRAGELPFEAGAGSDGGGMAVAYSDFATVNGIAEISARLYFVRGRLNSDTVVDLSDAIFLLGFLFSGGEAPGVPEAADVNADGVVDLSDPIYLLDYLFRGGPVIPAPFPEPGL